MSFDIQDIQWLRKLSPAGSPELYQIGSKLYNALLSIQTAVSNIEQQTNTNAAGTAQAPPPIQGVKVDARNGIFHISINHEAAFQRGVQYHAEYADNPQFANPFPISMGTNREWRGSLGAGTFHFRVAASYGISPPTDWVYHGGIQPKPVDGGGLPGPALPRLSQGSGTGAPGQGLQGPGTQPVRQPGVGLSGPRDPSPYTSFARFKPIVIRSGGVSGAGGGGGGGGGGTGITQLTGDVTAGPGAGSQAASVVKINGAAVPTSKAFVGTNGSGQLIAAATAPLTFASPYLTDGTNFYDPDGYQVTKPPSSGSLVWIGTAPGTISTAANGNLKIQSGAVSNPGFQSLTATASSEVILRMLIASSSASQSDLGCWLWDSTNNLIYSFSQTDTGAAPLSVRTWSYNGSGTPTLSSTVISMNVPYLSYAHLKLIVSAGTISAQICLDGETFDTLYSTAGIGTISKGGLMVMDSGTVNVVGSVIHLKVV